MHFIIDFDYTLFDTNQMRALLASTLHVDEEEWVDAEYKIKDAGKLYSPLLHCEILGIDPKRFHSALLEIAPECLYPDVLSFFDHYIEAQMTILSFGNVAWQEQKMEASGIIDIVNDIVATDVPKEEVIVQWSDESDAIIINDRGSEIDAMSNVFPTAQYILMQRDDAPYLEESCYTPVMTVETLSTINR